MTFIISGNHKANHHYYQQKTTFRKALFFSALKIFFTLYCVIYKLTLLVIYFGLQIHVRRKKSGYILFYKQSGYECLSGFILHNIPGESESIRQRWDKDDFYCLD